MNRPLVLAITGASGAVYATRLLQVLVHAGHDVHLTISPAGQAVLKQELDMDVNLNTFDPSPLLTAGAKVSFREEAAGSGRAARELASELTGERLDPPRIVGTITYHHYQDYMTPIASGSFLTAGMVICPCSGSTLGGVVHGTGSNLIHRAADVHLKERRRLILVPRETPLSLVHLENMRRACEAGAVVLPAAPGWYHGVRSLGDLVDFVVARILDQLDLEHDLMNRWGT